MKINKTYIFTFLVLLLIETIIAIFVHDAFVRPYIGDILVIFLMYSFIRGIVGKQIKFLPLYLFMFAALIEIGQYFQVLTKLNLQDNKFLSIIMGTSFDIKDVLCYLIGSLILILGEKLERKNS